MKELKLWFLSEQLITTLTAGETKIFREKVELLQTDRQDIKTSGMYENIYIYIYIYIQGGLWHYVDRKNFYMGIMGTRRLRRHFPVPLIF